MYKFLPLEKILKISPSAFHEGGIIPASSKVWKTTTITAARSEIVSKAGNPFTQRVLASNQEWQNC